MHIPGSTPALFMHIKSAFWYSKCAFNAHKKRWCATWDISVTVGFRKMQLVYFGSFHKPDQKYLVHHRTFYIVSKKFALKNLFSRTLHTNFSSISRIRPIYLKRLTK